jgi:hypothetical protein
LPQHGMAGQADAGEHDGRADGVWRPRPGGPPQVSAHHARRAEGAQEQMLHSQLFPEQWSSVALVPQWAEALGGTSRAGLRSKKPTGLSLKPV